MYIFRHVFIKYFVRLVPLLRTVFKISAGNGDVSYDAWSREGIHDGGPGCSPNPGIPCDNIYKDAAVDEWKDVRQVGWL